ncbi:uncharacterized protein LOC131946386 isoform X3 [Physella acuta]|uniref:uncharacterized protein LOC131946386 isoform X3 n=1 Tax=Physella acuta TaxID=109671 RepID=UPI0027DB1587|nr:uncharacterized protein LOC131946386 isoform X3 [Physella acuta]XP_059163099.1 uncharacterized protein LOC131946386 isoform X3 [Physella acuta]XP_059163100.1 uncharacterized protein LOC131946386 isoform X3 [Physella acuta]
MAASSQNGKAKPKISKQDYTNLLYSDSDSDRIPDLKLPPIKGKKQRRKIGNTKRDSDAGGVWSVLKVVMVSINFITIVILAGLTFWSLYRISDLQHQISLMQVSNTATPDTISKLETRVEKLDKTLADIRAGSLEELLKNTTDLKAKIDALEKANKEILASVSSSKQYMDLPIKFKDLTDTVAKIGSDTSHQSLSVEALDKRVAQLEAKSSNPTNPVNSVADEAASLRQELKEILDAQVANITQDLAQHLTRILSLEAVTRSLMGQNDSAVNVNEMYLLRGEFLAFKKDEHDNFKKSNASLYILNEDLDKLVARAERIENVIYNLTAAVEKFKNPGSAPSISTLSPILVSPSNTATTDGPIANGTEDKVGSPAQDDGHTMR